MYIKNKNNSSPQSTGQAQPSCRLTGAHSLQPLPPSHLLRIGSDAGTFIPSTDAALWGFQTFYY